MRRMVTTIPIKKETRELLRQVGRKGQTYDEIIRGLVETHEAFISHLYQILEEEKFTPLEDVIRELKLDV